MLETFSGYYSTADLESVFFEKDATIELEIGCGRGDFLAEYAPSKPDRVFIGVERHLVSLRKAVKKVQRTSAEKNTILINADILYLFENHFFKPNTISAIHLYFPDPWPKKKHQKRRLVTQSFLQTIEALMKCNAYLHLRSDNPAIYEEIITNIDESKLFEETDIPAELLDCKTSFEKRFMHDGKTINRSSFRVIRC